LTFVMRRPDEYEEISKAIRNSLLGENDSSMVSPILSESRTWHPDVEEISKELSVALGRLTVNYSIILQVLVGIERRLKGITALLKILKG
ncbi:hypothetical protein R0J87_21090, partial [Halomonas sp. SIMBA_159]